MPALFPDVALLHVHRADRLGNCQIDGYPHMDADIALAASTVLVTAEEIVAEEEIRRQPDRTVIPGFVVDALVHVPYGSYPHECYGLYDAEPAHFTRVRGRDPATTAPPAWRATSTATSTGRRPTASTSRSSAMPPSRRGTPASARAS